MRTQEHQLQGHTLPYDSSSLVKFDLKLSEQSKLTAIFAKTGSVVAKIGNTHTVSVLSRMRPPFGHVERNFEPASLSMVPTFHSLLKIYNAQTALLSQSQRHHRSKDIERSNNLCPIPATYASLHNVFASSPQALQYSTALPPILPSINQILGNTLYWQDCTLEPIRTNPVISSMDEADRFSSILPYLPCHSDESHDGQTGGQIKFQYAAVLAGSNIADQNSGKVTDWQKCSNLARGPPARNGVHARSSPASHHSSDPQRCWPPMPLTSKDELPPPASPPRMYISALMGQRLAGTKRSSCSSSHASYSSHRAAAAAAAASAPAPRPPPPAAAAHADRRDVLCAAAAAERGAARRRIC
jgi:hypothetical protein